MELEFILVKIRMLITEHCQFNKESLENKKILKGGKDMKFIGIDIGKISFKAVVINLKKEVKEIFWKAHDGEIEETWKELKEQWQIEDKDKVLVTGRFRDMLPYPSVPERVAQEKAVGYLCPEKEVTLIRLGGGGFSVLKTRKGKQSVFLLNPRCAAGTGSFLTQILGRLGLDIFQADHLVKNVKGLEITSRCGVTMKTDFTHLLNQGNQVADVIAGLLDSSAKNAVALALKSRVSPKTLVIGGLSVSQRIVQTIRENLNVTQVEVPSQALYFEALGAALSGLEKNLPKITNKPLASPTEALAEVKKIAKKSFSSFVSSSAQRTKFSSPLVFLQSLENSVKQVTKIDFPKTQECSENLVLGLDIGSTGSKLVLVAKGPIFEAYAETKGQPVQAAKNLILKVPSEFLSKIKAAGITGSGREIVSSLLQASLPEEKRQQVFVLNEIAAHARGALYYDPAVDTVVDIGGQDAKFTRLENGRVTDSCMNTVCSAGTGSFLAEQLQLLGLKDIGQLGKMALKSPRAVDLGQHCAVFIAEQIDETKRKGAKLEEIAAGLYYSIIKNYNNRVKGLREYGRKIFLQGKPAENLALACALAKVTGQQIVIPPSPGSMGALGIALLAKEEYEGKVWESSPVSLEKFLKSEVLNIQEFICQAKDGCRDGNQCRIKVMTVEQEDRKFKFLSGGACDKYEKIGKSKAMAEAPRPFLEREKLITSFILDNSNQLAKKTIGIPRGLETEEILPLAVVFFQELGFTVKVLENYGLKSLVEGAKLCQATFCSPVQILAGQAERLKEENFIFLPKITEIPGKKEEKRCWVCPLSQATPDLFSPKLPPKVLQPFLDLKGGYERNQKEFIRLGSKLGCSRGRTLAAFKKAVEAQKKFEKQCRQIGEIALAYAIEKEIPVVVVLGHPYIINSPLLSAGIAETIQEKTALSLPADCYPLEGKAPNLDNIYWGYGHRLLNVAFEARRQSGVYPLWLSVYSCGPDSFLIHFFQYLSQGKPYTILESDAYTGQAGFKTRVEVFLYSIKNYYPKQEKNLPDLSRFEIKTALGQTEGRKILVPWMGEGSKIVPALLKTGLGIEAEYLPMADEAALELGRQCTSGKECLPMIVTIGSLLKYQKNHPEEKLAYLMPQATGPCRFGQYQLLAKIILEKLGLMDQVNVISPTSETGYKLSGKFGSAMIAKSWSAFVLVDLLKDVLLETRPLEKIVGAAEQVFNRSLEKLENLISQTSNDWSGFGNLWGMANLAEIVVEEFKKIPQTKDEKPHVVVTGEIFVRLDEFSNGRIIRELESLGVRVKMAPFREWVKYTTWQRRKGVTTQKQKFWKVYLTWFIQNLIEGKLYDIFATALDWPLDHSVEEILKKAKPYLKKLRPLGESALTIGLPLLLWENKEIDGAVLVGPFECMPTRIAETQLALISEQTGLPVLSLSFYGDPLDKELLESFVWDLKKN